MSGPRIVQAFSDAQLSQLLRWRLGAPSALGRGLFNLKPGTKRLAIVRKGDYGPEFLEGPWGFLPVGIGTGRRIAVANIETAERDSRFGDAWRYGRVVVPLDGWYVWPEPWSLTPVYVFGVDGPLLAAGLTSWLVERKHVTNYGTLILTEPASRNMPSNNKRWPLILPAQKARLWADERADLAQVHAAVKRAEPFAPRIAWHHVSSAVNDIHENHESLIAKVAPL